jgi:hypothetical protein
VLRISSWSGERSKSIQAMKAPVKLW